MMQIISKLFVFICTLGFIGSCSDDFLRETEIQPTYRTTEVLRITPSSGYVEYIINIPDVGNAAYSIGQLPKWLVFKYLRGSFKNDVTTLKFTVQNVQASFSPGTYESPLTLVIEGYGVHVIPVLFVNE